MNWKNMISGAVFCFLCLFLIENWASAVYREYKFPNNYDIIVGVVDGLYGEDIREGLVSFDYTYWYEGKEYYNQSDKISREDIVARQILDIGDTTLTVYVDRKHPSYSKIQKPTLDWVGFIFTNLFAGIALFVIIVMFGISLFPQTFDKIFDQISNIRSYFSR